MPAIIINTKNKNQEKIVRAFLNSLEIDFYTEAQEEQALYRAMKDGKKTNLLKPAQKAAFIKSLKKQK